MKMAIQAFKAIPGFTKYEFDATTLRNIKTKKALGLKIKNGKYQLLSDAGKNIDLLPEKIMELCFAQIELPEGKSMLFNVNFLHHYKVEREEIVKRLGITEKQYLDSYWHYANRGYKEKIEKFLANGK